PPSRRSRLPRYRAERRFAADGGTLVTFSTRAKSVAESLGGYMHSYPQYSPQIQVIVRFPYYVRNCTRDCHLRPIGPASGLDRTGAVQANVHGYRANEAMFLKRGDAMSVS